MLTHLLKYAECNVCVLNEIRHLRNWCDFFACVQSYIPSTLNIDLILSHAHTTDCVCIKC